MGALLNSLQTPPCLRALPPPNFDWEDGCLVLAGVTGRIPASLPVKVPSGRGSGQMGLS